MQINTSKFIPLVNNYIPRSYLKPNVIILNLYGSQNTVFHASSTPLFLLKLKVHYGFRIRYAKTCCCGVFLEQFLHNYELILPYMKTMFIWYECKLGHPARDYSYLTVCRSLKIYGHVECGNFGTMHARFALPC